MCCLALAPRNHDQVMKEWIAKRVTELLGIEEEVLIGMIYNLLEDPQVQLADCACVHGRRCPCVTRVRCYAQVLSMLLLPECCPKEHALNICALYTHQGT